MKRHKTTKPRLDRDKLNQFSVSALIRSARGTRTQKDFASLIGTTQPLLCKYESGKITNPPAKIIEACLQHMHNRNNLAEITVGSIQRRVRDVLSGPERADARRAISELLYCLNLPR